MTDTASHRSPEERTRLRASLDSMLDPFILMAAVRDEDGRLIDLRYEMVNDAAAAHNRLTPEQMVGARLLDLFPGQLEDGPLRQYFHTIETGEPTVLDGYAYQHEILGQERRYDIRAAKSGDGLAITWRDVTDRHAAVERLAQSEHLYRLVTENSSEVVALADETRAFSWISESVAPVLGYRPDDLIGLSLFNLVHPDDAPRLVDEIQRSQTSGGVARVRLRLRLPDGTYCWAEAAGSPVIDEQGGLTDTRVISIHRVDDQVRVEEELTRQERLSRLITENSSDVASLVDADFIVRWISPAVRDLIDREPDEIVGTSALDLVHPDDVAGLLAEIARATRENTDSWSRFRWRHKDGGFRWVESHGRGVDEGAEWSGRVVHLRDIEGQVAAERAIESTERMYRLLAEHSSDVILLADADSRALWVSPSVAEALGWPPEDIVGRPAHEFIHPDDWPTGDGQGEVPAALFEVPARYRIRCLDGSWRWMDALARPLPTLAGEPARHVVRLRDIEAQVDAEETRAATETSYRMLAENASDVVWQVDDDGRILWVSPSVEAVLSWPVETLLGTPSSDLIDPADRARFVASTERVAIGHPIVGEFRARHADGRVRWMEISLRAARADDNAARIGTLRDIDDVVNARRRVEFMLRHDQATGLPVRDAVMDRVISIRGRLRHGIRLAVLTIGVDHLKDINDAFGHHVGDAVITTIAGRAAQALGDFDALGRGNGDEFLGILEDVTDPVTVAEVAERIRIHAHGEIEILGHLVNPTVSIGIALGTSRTDVETLLRDSTLAMHHAKDRGRDRWAFADPDLANEAAARMVLESAIRPALEDGGFVPWYQPIVSLRNGDIVGYEALVRWMRDGEVVEPDGFLPVAERAGLIQGIDVAVAEQVIERLATLPPELFVAMNVAPSTLESTPYATTIRDLLATHDVKAQRLHLEITETRLLNVDVVVVRQIEALAALGARWYVDDFGTGYSSISHVRDLPIAGLKLDRSFTEGVREGHEKSRHVADALLGLANGMGLDTVAEGIESQAEAAYLRTLGWQHGQGWLYGRAAPLP